MIESLVRLLQRLGELTWLLRFAGLGLLAQMAELLPIGFIAPLEQTVSTRHSIVSAVSQESGQGCLRVEPSRLLALGILIYFLLVSLGSLFTLSNLSR